MKNNPTNRNLKRINLKTKYILQNIFLLLLSVAVYCLAVYINGFLETNKKLLTLIFYGVIGFISFFVFYFIIKFICKIVFNKRERKRKKLVVALKEEDNFLKINSFKYNKNISIIENLNVVFNKTLENLKEISISLGYKGNFSYLNFTINDFLNFTNKTIDIVEFKVDEILSSPLLIVFKLHNKPLGYVENLLNDVIEKENKKEQKEGKSFLTKVFNKAVGVGIKVFFEDKLNGIIKYVCLEGYVVYNKNHKKALKRLKKYTSINDDIETLEVAV